MTMLFKIAVNNIKKKFGSYWAYFLSCSFSVFVLYLFISVMTGSSMQQVKTMKSFGELFAVGTVLTTLFSAFFIWYSNSFFLKSRKKEFATYMLLGMSKKQTKRLNLIENSAVLLLAFFTGIIAGMLLNKLFIMILYSFMKMKANIPFSVSTIGIISTAAVYMLIFLIVNLHGAAVINKDSLLELINASKKAERGLKVSVMTYIIGLLAIVFLAYGYLQSAKINTYGSYVWSVIFFVCVGTVLLFTSLISILIWLAKRNEKRLYSGTRLIPVSQLYHRYRGNVGVLSTISITTTVALCAVLALCGIYNKNAQIAHQYRPFSVEYIGSSQADKAFNGVIDNHSEIKIKSKTVLNPIIIKTQGSYSGGSYLVLPESELLAADAAQNSSRKVSLKNDGECYFVQNKSGSKDAIGKSIKLNYLNTQSALTVDGTDTDYYVAFDNFEQTLVVKDDLYNKMKKDSLLKRYEITGIELQNDSAAGNFVSELQKKMPQASNMMSYDEEINSLNKIMGIMLFIGIFIGLLFLTASCSILYFKTAMEAHEDKEKFATLIKIGISGKQLRSGIAKELAVIFGAPFAVAAVNTLVATVPMKNVMEINGIMGAYGVIVLVYALLYGIYYLVSVGKYIKTVTNE